MKKIFFYTAVSLFLIFSVTINLAQQEIPKLITDRPDQTESAMTIPKDYFQIETGFLYENQKISENNVIIEKENLILGSTLCRYGLNSFFEFRFGGEYLYSQNLIKNNKTIIQGFQNIILGTKIQLRRDQKYFSEMALIVQSIIPFGNANLKPDRFEPEFILCIGQDLSQVYSLGVNLGAQDNSELKKYFFLYAISLGIEIGPRVNSFIEIYGSAVNGSESSNNIDCGLTYFHTQNIQVDFSFGTSILSETTDWFGGFGLSVRLPK